VRVRSTGDIVSELVAEIRSGGRLEGRDLHDRLMQSTTPDVASAGSSRDAVALEVARRFLHGEVDFYEADVIMNAVWGILVDEAGRTGQLTLGVAFAVFEAFDAGEFDLGDGLNRVEQFTVPMLLELLEAPG
jgi:hypothetical protein